MWETYRRKKKFQWYTFTNRFSISLDDIEPRQWVLWREQGAYGETFLPWFPTIVLYVQNSLIIGRLSNEWTVGQSKRLIEIGRPIDTHSAVGFNSMWEKSRRVPTFIYFFLYFFLILFFFFNFHSHSHFHFPTSR